MKPVRRISQPAAPPVPSGGAVAPSRSGDGASRPYDPSQGRSAARGTVKGDTVAPDTRKAARAAPAPAEAGCGAILSDGRAAWPVAQAAGVCCRTFRARLRYGWSPDDAVRPVGTWRMGRPPRRGGSAVVLSDGRAAWPVAKAAGVSSQTFHHRLKAGWSPDEAVRPVGERRPGRKASSLADAVLADGRLALPVALAAGVSRQKFMDRLRYGMSPDEAVHASAMFRLSDGRPAVRVARASGVTRVQFFRRLRAGLTPDEAVRHGV